jgi:hypothetical protein
MSSNLSQERKTAVKIRDLRSKFYQIDNEFISGGYAAAVGVYGIAVYNVLAAFANNGSQQAWPSHKTIAELVGCSRRKVIDAVRDLERFNIIQVQGRLNENGGKTSNMVTLIDRSEWTPCYSDAQPPVHESNIPGARELQELNEHELNESEQHEGAPQKKSPVGATDYLEHVVQCSQDDVPVNDAPVPEDQWIAYGKEVEELYRKNMGIRSLSQPQRDALADVGDIVGSSVKLWDQFLQEAAKTGMYPYDTQKIVDTYRTWLTNGRNIRRASYSHSMAAKKGRDASEKAGGNLVDYDGVWGIA